MNQIIAARLLSGFALSLLAFASIAIVPPLRAAEPLIIFDMDTLKHQPGEFTDEQKHKHPVGAVELVPGKFGQAVKFSFVDKGQGFMTAGVRANADWDESAGFSFWVKGDGSHNCGGIELIDRDDFGLRYGYCFPIDSTEWRKITVSWRDVIPELNGPPVDAKNGFAPSKFGNFWFGRWFYWREHPARSYTIDQVQLEPKIEAALAPSGAAPSDSSATSAPAAPLARIRQKIREHQPVTIVTMGDSLTDEHHWANRKDPWPRQLEKLLAEQHKVKVALVNPAIGGTTLSQNIILTPRWSYAAPAPDLVTIWFGGNDWDSGVRGPRFAEYLRLAIDRVRRQTSGSADILLMTTCPGHDRWQTYAELEEAARLVAIEKNVGLLDIAALFRAAASNADEAQAKEYWAWDKVHLGAKGHEVTSAAVLQAIAAPVK